jgi:hypothetical protein
MLLKTTVSRAAKKRLRKIIQQAKTLQRSATNGCDYVIALSYLQFMSETVSARLLILVELAVITFGIYWPTGFHFRTPGGGAELPFLWGMMVFVVALRGGGPFSLDSKIGWEL